MKLSLDWLSDFVEFREKDPRRIADVFTASVAEVDEVEVQGAILEHCCIGKVLSVEKHPGADKLQLCDVQTDRGVKRVVCGGTNLREGMCVAFAHVGATVKWHGEQMQTLQETRIRGETSEGMICAASELNLTEQYPNSVERNIIDMGNMDAQVGTPLRDYFGLRDTVFHVDNHAITHRADLFSHVGFARECVALGLGTWKKKPGTKLPKFGRDPIPFKCHVDIRDLVPRYLCCTIAIDALGVTPDWMRRRLQAVGYRSLHLPIDITNYVAAEVGMPLHSFDAADIRGDIRFRTTRKGERIVTLDGENRELPEGAVVLSDGEGIFDLMGVMGGLRSSTKESTRTIYLHSAIVDPVAIRKTIIATGHRTDASTVYEKGIPRVAAAAGFYRALELFLAHVPGARIASREEAWGDEGKAKRVTVAPAYINRMLGAEISEREMMRILHGLDFSVAEKGGQFTVIPPPHRLGDIEGKHDIVEEVGRIYGYDNIRPTLPEANIAPPKRDMRLHKVRESLKENGYFELVPISLTGPELLSKCGVGASGLPELENPLGREVSLMTPGTLPGLLEHAETELQHAQGDYLKTFTAMRVFSAGGEHDELGMLVCAKGEGGIKGDPFLIAKRGAMEAFAGAGHRLEIAPVNNCPTSAHPGRVAELRCSGKPVGLLYEVHPAVRSRFGLPSRVAALHVDIHVLFETEPRVSVALSLPEFPGVSYDLTVTRHHGQHLQDLLEKIRKSSALLESVEVADLYSGKPLDSHQYNLTLRCTYRAKDRTLTEEEVRKEFAKVEQIVS